MMIVLKTRTVVLRSTHPKFTHIQFGEIEISNLDPEYVIFSRRDSLDLGFSGHQPLKLYKIFNDITLTRLTLM